ncbi:MAG TPA: pseudouridine-5'-phosphate glycosidase [Galbitalea sp.]|jgi:pseudouridine-5'-phosphate glycosidase|nr:pseudouridine-5'-phosphate glycosidase [Galbitalea sp.]
MTSAPHNPIRVSAEVAQAVHAGQPVVALESTIFTHGLPRPINLEVALDAETILRDRGVVPATIGIIAGVAVIGMSTDEIRDLSTEDAVVKVSRRDLPIAAAKRLSGGTTVAATAFLAHHAAIRVFSTGGLGGVHHGASESFDESADLSILAETPILLVSAGVKSILDIPATLERLETLSVTVAGYRTTSYPGFYVRESGSTIEYSVNSPAEAAEILSAQDAFGINSAVLIANPIAEDQQLPPELHTRILAEAWKAAEVAGVAGNATTPYLLDYIQRATSGQSLAVNIAVYRGNVTLGGEIALALG